MVTVGILGSGYMAETHADRYREMDDATVGAVASPNGAPAFVADRDLDATAYTDVDAFLADADVDALDVCTPTPTHREFVEAAADRGLDVFCEKPLARTVADAGAAADAAAAAGVTLMVGHVLRFFPDYAAVRADVVAGGVGDPGTVRARRHSPPPDQGDWFADDEQSGGVFLDLAIHEFDYCRWLLGDVARVFARRETWGAHQSGHAVLRFEDGAVAHVEAGWDRPPGADLRSELEVAGDEGLVEFDTRDVEAVSVSTRAGEADAGPALERDGYRRELDAFVECVRTGADPPVPVADAVAAVRVAQAANRSATRGEPVAVSEVGR